MYFDNVKKNFGFGMMRLPMKGDDVDYDQVNLMVDRFLENGFNYFDTAHGYLDGKSEIAIRKCLVKRHERSKYVLTNKLSTHFFDKEEDIIPLFNKQLEATGVDYFDFYLLHAQDAKIYEKYKRTNAYDVVRDLKEKGRVKHIGISFHDKADVLEKILNEQDGIEVVQIQFNYVDYEDEAVESRKVYEVCRKYNKPVIVMEPVKGGTLTNLPEKANEVLSTLNGVSAANLAIRFAASFDGMFMVLSGMSSLDQMNENVSFMKDFKKLDEREMDAVGKINNVFHNLNMIKCTACHYCTLDNDCPRKIKIPELFACYNRKKIFQSWNQNYYYNTITATGGKASECIKCGKCEKICPQHLPIRELLEDVAKEFEKK